MGEIIALTRPDHPPRGRPPVGTSAEILFFTGVRYMRMDDTELSRAAARRRRRVRLRKLARSIRLDRQA